MKKVIYCLAVAGLVLGLASCQKEKEEENVTNFVDAEAVYVMELDEDVHYFMLNLYTDVQVDDSNYIVSAGELAYLTLLTSDTVLVPGKYVTSDNYEAGTIVPKFSEWIELGEGGETLYDELQKDGSVEISVKDDIYTINVNMVDSADVAHTGKFVGKVPYYSYK